MITAIFVIVEVFILLKISFYYYYYYMSIILFAVSCYGREGNYGDGGKPLENIWNYALLHVREKPLLNREGHYKTGTFVLLLKRTGV